MLQVDGCAKAYRFGNRANPQAKDKLGIGLQTKPARDISCRPTNFDDSSTDCYFKVQSNLLTKIMPSAQVSLRQITITTCLFSFKLNHYAATVHTANLAPVC